MFNLSFFLKKKKRTKENSFASYFLKFMPKANWLLSFQEFLKKFIEVKNLQTKVCLSKEQLHFFGKDFSRKSFVTKKIESVPCQGKLNCLRQCFFISRNLLKNNSLKGNFSCSDFAYFFKKYEIKNQKSLLYEDHTPLCSGTLPPPSSSSYILTIFNSSCTRFTTNTWKAIIV